EVGARRPRSSRWPLAATETAKTPGTPSYPEGLGGPALTTWRPKLMFAEHAILKALPQMAEAAQSDELRGAFAVHLNETEGQVKRLERVFQLVGERPEGVECKAIQGIIEEGQEILQAFEGGEALDAGLIAAAQAVEHYEIN